MKQFNIVKITTCISGQEEKPIKEVLSIYNESDLKEGYLEIETLIDNLVQELEHVIDYDWRTVTYVKSRKRYQTCFYMKETAPEGMERVFVPMWRHQSCVATAEEFERWAFMRAEHEFFWYTEDPDMDYNKRIDVVDVYEMFISKPLPTYAIDKDTLKTLGTIVKTHKYWEPRSVFIPMWEYNSCFPKAFFSLEEAKENAQEWCSITDDLGHYDEDEIDIVEILITKDLPKDRLLRQIDLPEYGKIIKKHLF